MDDYERLKGFLAHFISRSFRVSVSLPADQQPLAVLLRMEATAPAQARRGLRMAINDCLESSVRLSVTDVASIDSELSAKALPTLSELRVRFSRRIRSALKRGKITNEVEYYEIRNALEIVQGEDGKTSLSNMLNEYEARLSGGKA